MARTSIKTPGAAISASLKKLGATPQILAEAIGVTVSAVTGLINGGKITPELSVKLGRALGEKEKHFADLQLSIEIADAAKKAGKVTKIRKVAGKPGRKPGTAKKLTVSKPAGKKPGRKPGVKKPDSAASKPGRGPGRPPKAK